MDVPGDVRPDAGRPKTSPGRALVALGARAVAVSDERPLAGFVAQLIASRDRLPAYRKAGRAAPGEVADTYRRVPTSGRPSVDRAV